MEEKKIRASGEMGRPLLKAANGVNGVTDIESRKGSEVVKGGQGGSEGIPRLQGNRVPGPGAQLDRVSGPRLSWIFVTHCNKKVFNVHQNTYVASAFMGPIYLYSCEK